jgi:hypothetical protein
MAPIGEGLVFDGPELEVGHPDMGPMETAPPVRDQVAVDVAGVLRRHYGGENRAPAYDVTGAN